MTPKSYDWELPEGMIPISGVTESQFVSILFDFEKLENNQFFGRTLKLKPLDPNKPIRLASPKKGPEKE